MFSLWEAICSLPITSIIHFACWSCPTFTIKFNSKILQWKKSQFKTFIIRYPTNPLISDNWYCYIFSKIFSKMEYFFHLHSHINVSLIQISIFNIISKSLFLFVRINATERKLSWNFSKKFFLISIEVANILRITNV